MGPQLVLFIVCGFAFSLYCSSSFLLSLSSSSHSLAIYIILFSDIQNASPALLLLPPMSLLDWALYLSPSLLLSPYCPLPRSCSLLSCLHPHSVINEELQETDWTATAMDCSLIKTPFLLSLFSAPSSSAPHFPVVTRYRIIVQREWGEETLTQLSAALAVATSGERKKAGQSGRPW